MNWRSPLLVLMFIWPLATCAFAEQLTLEQRWQSFAPQLIALPAQQVVSQIELNQYPQKLLLSSNAYPDLNRYSWQELRALYRYQSSCQDTDLIRNSAKQTLQQAFNLERVICEQRVVDDISELAALTYPTGGSFADRYLAYLQSKDADLAQKASKLAELQHQLSIANRQHPLHAVFGTLPEQGRDSLISGELLYLAPSNTLWRNTLTGIETLPHEQWSSLAQQHGVAISPLQQNQACALVVGNLCINTAAPVVNTGWLLSLPPLIAIALAIGAWWERLQHAREKKFILQMLTHELRTPITSLGLTVEQFRDEYDSLSDNNQNSFWRLTSDYQRLQQLTNVSRGYLSQDKQHQFERQQLPFEEWLEACVAQHELDYTLTTPLTSQQLELSLPYYWLGVCLSNLLRNAKRHGKAPIQVIATVDDKLTIEVRDAGTLKSCWLTLVKPNKNKHDMGVGLVIVKRLMRQMGGQLSVTRKPTNFKLELPL